MLRLFRQARRENAARAERSYGRASIATKTRLTGLGRPPVELDAEGRLVAFRQEAYSRDAKIPNDFKYVFSGQPAYLPFPA
jgi:hypothetical protein